MSLLHPNRAAKKEAKRARNEERERRDRIESGTSSIRNAFSTAFSPDYYAGIEKAGKNYYTPQLNTQYADSLKQLRFALSRQGLTDSSAFAQRMGKAKESFNLANQGIVDQVRGLVTQRRQDVANSESSALGQLQASADPASAMAQATNQIQANSAMPAFSPLGQVFTDATAGLATQAELERSGRNRYDLGVSRWGNNTRRYVQNVGG